MNRFWIGGTGNWGDTSSWSATSGGAGGASVPTSSDDVFIDTNSGFGAGGTISLTGSGYWTTNCHDITCTSGHTYTIDCVNSDLAIYGSAVFEAGITIDGGTWIYFLSNTTETITNNGVSIPYIYFGDDSGNIYTGTWTLQDDLSCGSLNIQTGTFDANDFNVNITDNSTIGSALSTVVYMGNGTWTVSGTHISLDILGNVTLYCDSSTIEITSPDAYGEMFFYGGGKTYNKLLIDGNVVDRCYIYDNNTFNIIELTGINEDHGNDLYFGPGSTQTLNNFIVNGIAGYNVGISAPYRVIYNNILSASTTYNLYSGTTTAVGQSITGDGLYIYRVYFDMSKTGSPTGNVYAKLYAHTGTFGTNGIPTGSVLATSDAVSAANTWSYFYFTGTNKIRLEDGTNYFVVIEYTDGDASNYKKVLSSTQDGSYYAGNLAYYSSGAWTAVSNQDVDFQINTIDQYTLSKSSGSVTCNYVNMANSNVTGGAGWYKGTGFVDEGNNTGWRFNRTIEDTAELTDNHSENKHISYTAYSKVSKNETDYTKSRKDTTSYSKVSKNVTNYDK